LKTIITYGTFDFLHIGHINLLEYAKSLGDYLIVGLSTDEFNRIKNKESHSSYKDRKKIIESLIFVNKVIPETGWYQKKQDIIQLNVDIFVMGDDWLGQFDILNSVCKVVYKPRTTDISSSLIRLGL